MVVVSTRQQSSGHIFDGLCHGKVPASIATVNYCRRQGRQRRMKVAHGVPRGTESGTLIRRELPAFSGDILACMKCTLLMLSATISTVLEELLELYQVNRQSAAALGMGPLSVPFACSVMLGAWSVEGKDRLTAFRQGRHMRAYLAERIHCGPWHSRLDSEQPICARSHGEGLSCFRRLTASVTQDLNARWTAAVIASAICPVSPTTTLGCATYSGYVSTVLQRCNRLLELIAV